MCRSQQTAGKHQHKAAYACCEESSIQPGVGQGQYQAEYNVAKYWLDNLKLSASYWEFEMYVV